jgi:hypothetical protein
MSDVNTGRAREVRRGMEVPGLRSVWYLDPVEERLDSGVRAVFV